MGFRIKFGIDSSKYEMGVDRMKEKTKELGDGFGKVKKAAAAMAAVFAGGAMLSALEKMTDKVKELNAQARLFDTTTQSVQRLTRVAQENGLVFKDIADAIHDVTEKAQDAMSGNDNFAKSFDAMGISAEEFLRLDLEGKFFAMQEGFQHAEKGAQGFLAANELAGGAAQKLIPVWSQSTKEVRALADATAVTSKESVEVATKMTKVYEVIKNKLIGAFFSLTDWAFKGGAALMDLGEDLATSVTSNVRGLVSELENLYGILKDIATFDFKGARDGLADMGEGMSTERMRGKFQIRGQQITRAETRAKAAQLPALREQQAQAKRDAGVDAFMNKGNGIGVGKFAKGFGRSIAEGLEKAQRFTKRAAERHDTREGRKKDLESLVKTENKERLRRESELDRIVGRDSTRGEQFVTGLQSIGGGDGGSFVARDPVLEEAKKQRRILEKIAANTAANDASMQRINKKAEEVN